jgi:hypothetical protein
MNKGQEARLTALRRIQAARETTRRIYYRIYYIDAAVLATVRADAARAGDRE